MTSPARTPERGRGRHRLSAPMSPTGFEKWQALGNDYLIFEERALPFALTAAAHRAHLRRPHRRRLGRDPAAVGARRARLRRAPAHLQPRRLGVRAVGQRRARGGHVPAPQRLDGLRPLLDPDRRRGDPPAHHRPRHLHPGHGPRAHGLGGLSVGRRRRRGAARGRRAHLALSARRRRQPAVRDPRRRRRRARGARPARDRRGDHGARALSQPHERLVVQPSSRPASSARGSTSAAWGRRCPPARAPAAPRSPTSCAAASRP